MEEELRRILYYYLVANTTLDDVTDWMAKNIWDTPNTDCSLVDQVAHELAFLDDGLISENDFREQVRSLLSNIVFHQYHPETTATASSSTTREEVIRALVA